MVTDAERCARAALLRATEPATVAVVRHIRAVGPEAALRDIHAGRRIGGVDLEGMRARLADRDGAADLQTAAALSVRLVCPGDAEWPAGLDDLARIDADCLGLWVRGPRDLAETCRQAVAVVGTRAASEYGEHVAAEFGAGLARRGWAVVSGLAYGIDAAAHRGALSVAGATVAVLACGVDVAYPKGNQSLHARIAADGLVVSEHPPGAAPQRVRFLVRNRLIAALSAGTVVVEAAARSGARSTARHAGELLRHVMAVPGPVTAVTSVGCHQLLRDRPDAALVTSVDEVVEQVGPVGALAERATGPVRRRDLLGPAVSRVLDAVPAMRPVTVDRIARTAGMSEAAVEGALAALAVHGLVAASDRGWAMTRLGRQEGAGPPAATAEELPLLEF